MGLACSEGVDVCEDVAELEEVHLSARLHFLLLSEGEAEGGRGDVCRWELPGIAVAVSERRRREGCGR